MDRQTCPKCGGIISNDFNHTLAFCTNCGVSINLTQNDKTGSLVSPKTSFSPAPQNYDTNSNSKKLLYLFGCLGLLGAAALLSAIGFYGYYWWAKENPSNPEYNGKIVPPNSQTVRFVTSEPVSLDPQVRAESLIIHALFDSLAEYNNQTSDLKPSLAISWQRSPDGSVWTFSLRKEAKWSDGKPITASDFVYSWRRALNPQVKSIYADLLYDIKNAERYNNGRATAEEVGVRAIDDLTLQVTMEKPTPFFDKLVALNVFRPVPQTAIEKFGENWTKPENIVTSGAFKLTEWSPKNQTVIERNPQFWDNTNTRLEKVVFISDQKTLSGSKTPVSPAELYEKGEIDARLAVSSPDETLKNKKDYSLQKTLGIEFLYLNTTVKPFNDVRVRRAFSLAIDREKLKERNISNFPTASIVPEIKGYENAKGAGYNPNEARKLLSEAGFPQGVNFPEVEYIYNISEKNREITQLVQEQWQKELGVKVKLVNLEFREFLKRRSALEYTGIARGGWFADYADPFNFLNLFSLEKNESGWKDNKFVEMLEKANAETDQNKRFQMLSDAENYLLEQQPIIPLAITSSGFLCQPYVKNLAFNSLGQVNWREVFIEQ